MVNILYSNFILYADVIIPSTSLVLLDASDLTLILLQFMELFRHYKICLPNQLDQVGDKKKVFG